MSYQYKYKYQNLSLFHFVYLQRDLTFSLQKNNYRVDIDTSRVTNGVELSAPPPFCLNLTTEYEHKLYSCF